ncbi:unnamed protein product [Urochloa decumbens]|uniref:Uncharacterized protein n=1 Tax=Urochloa decumbens TaxID=240449 RepID=A0ABC9A2I4_9POAL
MSSSRESWWPELAALRALMARDAAAGVPAAVAAVAGRELRQQQPAGRGGGREDHAAAAGKRAKVMHLLLWGPK